MTIPPQGVVRSTSCLVLRWGFRGQWIEWRYFRLDKSKMPSRLLYCKIQMAISPRHIIRFTPCLVLGWGFRGRRIEWRWFHSTKFNRYVRENNARGIIRLVTIWSISCTIYGTDVCRGQGRRSRSNGHTEYLPWYVQQIWQRDRSNLFRREIWLSTKLKMADVFALYYVTQKIPSWGFLTFCPNGWVLLVYFTHLLYVPIYARLQIFIQSSPTVTKLCHIKCDHPACVSVDGGQFEHMVWTGWSWLNMA